MNSKMPGPIFVSSKSDSDTIIWISADTDTDCCAALLCFEQKYLQNETRITRSYYKNDGHETKPMLNCE